MANWLRFEARQPTGSETESALRLGRMLAIYASLATSARAAWMWQQGTLTRAELREAAIALSAGLALYFVVLPSLGAVLDRSKGWARSFVGSVAVPALALGLFVGAGFAVVDMVEKNVGWKFVLAAAGFAGAGGGVYGAIKWLFQPVDSKSRDQDRSARDAG